MSFFGLNFGQSADIDIVLDNQDERKMAEIRDENGRKERHYLFFDGESVAGKVNVTLHRKTNRLEHQGIKIEFLGHIELYYDRGNHHEFLSLVKELARPGDLVENTSFDFEFNQVEKPYESYTGANVRLRYFLRVTIVRRLTDMTKEMDLLVHTLSTFPEMNNPIKMEVGIEDCLHIEFEYNKSKYHLKDVIVGKIYFLLVRIKIKHMEVAILKREYTGSAPNALQDSETIAKYEIMDGAPVKGESIPIRVFLAGYDLTPTMKEINKKFSVRYFLNLVLVDEEERRYYKQQEIILWRKSDRQRKLLQGQMVRGGGGYYGGPQVGYTHAIPQAMARHIAGDQPSLNIRTAPTPSDPSTPVVEPSNFTPGIVPPSMLNPAGHNSLVSPGGHIPEPIMEDMEEHETHQSDHPTSQLPAGVNTAATSAMIDAEVNGTAVGSNSVNNCERVFDGENLEEEEQYLTESLGKKAVISSSSPEILSAPVISSNGKEQNRQQLQQQSGAPDDATSVAVSTSAAAPTVSNGRDQDDLDEDNKPRPPEDDSVPDMDDSLRRDDIIDDDATNSSSEDLFASSSSKATEK